MPTNKPRVTFALSEGQLERLEDYRIDQRIKNQSQAILSLIEKGLSDIEKSGTTFEEPPEEKRKFDELVKKYRLLDPYGKEAVDGVLDVVSKRCEEERQKQAAILREQRERLEAAEEIAPETVYFLIPGFVSAASAGLGQPAENEYSENFKLKKEPPYGTSYIIRVSGDSMEPTYHDGEKVFVHAQSDIPVGKIGIFYMDGQNWIKELGKEELISHNPVYPPRSFTDDIRCQGLVLGVCDESYFE